MVYSSGFLKDRVTVLNRKEAVQGKFGLDVFSEFKAYNEFAESIDVE